MNGRPSSQTLFTRSRVHSQSSPRSELPEPAQQGLLKKDDLVSKNYKEGLVSSYKKKWGEEAGPGGPGRKKGEEALGQPAPL